MRFAVVCLHCSEGVVDSMIDPRTVLSQPSVVSSTGELVVGAPALSILNELLR